MKFPCDIRDEVARRYNRMTLTLNTKYVHLLDWIGDQLGTREFKFDHFYMDMTDVYEALAWKVPDFDDDWDESKEKQYVCDTYLEPIFKSLNEREWNEKFVMPEEHARVVRCLRAYTKRLGRIARYWHYDACVWAGLARVKHDQTFLKIFANNMGHMWT